MKPTTIHINIGIKKIAWSIKMEERMHQDCVLTAIKLFAKTMKYEYCVKVH